MLLRNVLARTSSFLINTNRTNLLLAAQANNFSFHLSRLLSDRRYSIKHEWIELDNADKSVGKVGISHYAQEALGDVVYCQVPDVGTVVSLDEEVGAVESVKAANEIYTPVSGKILEINKALEDRPGLINTSCYDEGWIFKIKISDQSEVDKLMDTAAYEEYLKSVN